VAARRSMGCSIASTPAPARGRITTAAVIQPDPGISMTITAEEFFTAQRRAAELGDSDAAAEWVDLASGLCGWPRRPAGHTPKATEVFLTSRITGSEGIGTLDSVHWCLAEELLDPASVDAARAEIGVRLKPLRESLERSCPACGAPGLVVGRNYWWNDAAQEPHCFTELAVLCLQQPHAVQFASAQPWQWFDAVK
jgi:hypothetical protein